jgi:SPP1 family predicted phage head-tail adaptor
MKAGKLRHRVSIQRSTPTDNEVGEGVLGWATIATVWAAIETLNGRELMRAQAAGANSTSKITIRYYSGLTVKDQILFGARTFEINSIQNTDERNIELVLFCTEAV